VASTDSHAVVTSLHVYATLHVVLCSPVCVESKVV
jgi:hypothetical protein